MLLGTAHVSRTSVDAVTEMAHAGDFDAIAVELCPARHQALTKQQQWKEMDLYRIIRERKAGLVMANLALGAYQRRIAEQFGIEPGAELKAAADAAEELELPLQLIEQRIEVFDSAPECGRKQGMQDGSKSLIAGGGSRLHELLGQVVLGLLG